jgi:hypothetical protein
MYRPVQPQQGNPPVRTMFFSDKNYNTLQTVLAQDFQQRRGVPLNDLQRERLSKTLNHYLPQVYQAQGDKPIQTLNKEVLTLCAKDFSDYLQRKELTKNTSPIKTVMDEGLFQETSQRFERLTQERNEVKALPPPMPDFRMDFKDDGPPPAELFEYAKKQREMEALRSAQQNAELVKADSGLQSRVAADSMFRNAQDSQNRNSELALAQRQQNMTRPGPTMDLSLAIMPDRRDLLVAPIGSFDTMTSSPLPRELGQATSNPTIVQPLVASPTKNDLPQNYVQREDRIVSYREIENNLFIYSADRDWLINSKENRYNFTVVFNPGEFRDKFHTFLGTQQKFKNIVRIELVKCIMPGESLDVSVSKKNVDDTIVSGTDYQDNILNFPYITVNVEELENNNYGTDNFLDRSFGVLQYDAKWVSDRNQENCTPGYIAMIPKFLKCQKDFYPTPLSTLQKMTINLRRPNGELISATPDTYDIAGILGAGWVLPGVAYPFTVGPRGTSDVSVAGNPANFYIVTNTFFSKFSICKGDRIQIAGYDYLDTALNGADGGALRAFCNWINRPEGHIVLDYAYTNTTASMVDGVNDVGYANILVIQGRYQDPATGSTALNPFGTSFSNVLNAYGGALTTPCRLIDLNKQLNLVFRIITREMDALPQIRPDNNY